MNFKDQVYLCDKMVGLGAVLCQLDSNGYERAIGFASRILAENTLENTLEFIYMGESF